MRGDRAVNITEFVQNSTMLKFCSIIVLSMMMLALTFLFVYLVIAGQVTTALELSGLLGIGLGGINNILGVHLGSSTTATATLAAADVVAATTDAASHAAMLQGSNKP